MTTRPDVLAYYFPHWHEDSRDAQWIRPGFTEWDVLRAARPRFPGHRQPRVPALGYRDETDPTVMREEAHLAYDHGVDAFLFDYYWYEDGPYLQRALDEGFLGGPDGAPLRFALMWANHDLIDLYPLPAPSSGEKPRLLSPGAVSREAFERMVDHVVEAYFTHPAYYRVDGRPFFSIYEVGTFVHGMGGVEEAADALRGMVEKARRAGLPGVHLDAVVWGTGILPNHVTLDRPADLLQALGVDSASSYTWMHHVDLTELDFPVCDWDEVRRTAFAQYRDYPSELGLPFLPNLSVGWDSSPRTAQEATWERNLGYGGTPSADCTPATLQRAAEEAWAILDAQPAAPRMVTVNAWNEWTEGSYLLPDVDRGSELLEALAAAFPR